MFNKVVFVGRLTRDPELRYTSTGKAVANFSLAVDRAYKREGQPEADFFRVTVWGKQGENVANYTSKGQMVAVDGRIEINKYTDKEGQERTGVDVTANDVRFLSSGQKKTGTAPSSGEAASAPADLDDFSDDGLPF